MIKQWQVTPTMATCHCGMRGSMITTLSPGPTPLALSALASRSDRRAMSE
jgi:hypothetical protein